MKISCILFSNTLFRSETQGHAVTWYAASLHKSENGPKISRGYFHLNDNRLQCLQNVLVVLNIYAMTQGTNATGIKATHNFENWSFPKYAATGLH